MSPAVVGRSPDPVAGLVAELVARLRRAGLWTGSREAVLAYQALLVLDLADPIEVRDGMRIALARSPAEQAIFDEVFNAWIEPDCNRRAEEVEVELPGVAEPGGRHGEFEDGGEEARGAASDQRRLRTLDFAEMTEEDRAEAARLVEEIGRLPPLRMSRRARPARRGRRLDPGATLRRSRRFDHDPVEIVYREQKQATVPINMILDVSGSMEPYAEMLLYYLRGNVVARRSSEAFVFGTEAARVTDQLRSGSAAEPFAALVGDRADWGGGTTIGAAIGEVNRKFGCYFRRGGITVIASDGWDRGHPDLLAAEMTMLRARSRAMIWLSPHSERPGFEPLVAGLRAALPYIDLLLSAESVDSIERLSASLGNLGWARDPASAGNVPPGATAG